MQAIDKFKTCFPFWADKIVKWTPNKDTTVRVELEGKIFFVFTYIDERTWKLETMRSYVNGLK